jgi:hypothetical protein
MSLTRLQEDLLQEFKEEKQTINNQLEIFEPLAENLRKPAAQRLVSQGTLIIFEVICYVLCGGAIALAVLMNKVYPFSVWDYIHYRGQLPDVPEGNPTMADMQNFTIVLHVLLGLAGLLFLIIARLLSSVRRKNFIINSVGKDIKTLVGQHLVRKATIKSIEERHFLNNTFDEEGKTDVNSIPNPGFGD